MIRYCQQGELPQKKHIQNVKDGCHLWEEMVSTSGFKGIYSTKYHRNYPPAIEDIQEVKLNNDKLVKDTILSPIHILPKQGLSGDFISSRCLLLKNDDLSVSMLHPNTNLNGVYKNAHASELYFIHKGHGIIKTEYGVLNFKEGDYIYIPKTIIYTFDLKSKENKWLLLESRSALTIPQEFKNDSGQILDHAPYSERDFKLPVLRSENDDKVPLYIKTQEKLLCYEIPHHPFDVIAWDGYFYPIVFSIYDYSPIVGKLHQPPSVHKVFENENCMITNFVPRLCDFHSEAIPIPYFHSNIDCEEILYYFKGEFMSRKGIREGSITLHPSGIPHGPQPGKIEASLGLKEVDEYAVMIDTFNPVYMTEKAIDWSDRDYFKSWNKAT